MTDDFQFALGKGCLAGMALAAVFFLVGALLYLVARTFGVEHGVSLVIGIAGGPVLVSAVVLGGFVRRAKSRVRPPISEAAAHDATTTWDDT
jgi:hypothetical protein